MNLEDKLMENVKAGKKIDIERALLILSGLNTEKEIIEYKLKLDEIDAGFQVYMEANDTQNKPKEIAEALHNYLWKDKTEMYDFTPFPKKMVKTKPLFPNFFLTDVIDSQRSMEDKSVGQCIGLTSLYTVLGLRQGLKLSILLNLDHMLSRFNDESFKKKIDIEHTTRKGFGFIKKNPKHMFKEHNLNCLPAVVLLTRGLKKEVLNNPTGARRDYEAAERFDNTCFLVLNNWGTLEYDLGFFKKAIKKYNKAIELYDQYAEAFNNRGLAKRKLGDLESALEDFRRATVLDPKYVKAFRYLAETKLKLGRDKEAIEDFNQLICLEPKNACWYYKRGRSREKAEDIAGAFSDYEQAVEMDSNYDGSFYTA
jgi:tetratricopeptide (TPR) repeat protein